MVFTNNKDFTPNAKINSQPEKVFPYLRVIAFLNPQAQPEKISSSLLTAKFVPGHLAHIIRNVKKEDIIKAIANKESNRKAYNTLCLAFISQILAMDQWKVIYTDSSRFEENVFGISTILSRGIPPDELFEGVAFVAQRHSRKIHFFFDALQDYQKWVLPGILKKGNIDFKDIRVMIVRSEHEMNSKREIKNANKWPGGFFVCFEQIQKKYREINLKEYTKFCGTATEFISNEVQHTGIATFKAEVIDNIPVGKKKPNHYKLRFRAPGLSGIFPGQFIMMDTVVKSRFKKNAPVRLNQLKSSFNLTPEAFLKRPFGIHRALYPNFKPEYLKNLALPPVLSTVLYTVFPNEFDIFYKVLENGVGTNEMKMLKKGQKVQMTGPLGKKLDLRGLRTLGFKEIHLIGGGVGMAPLIFMVQVLRFLAFRVKVFIGIESIDLLKHKDELFEGFVEKPDDVKLYIDDLLAIGVDHEDIYVSCDKTGTSGNVVSGYNFHTGLVGDQYEKYIRKNQAQKNILAFTCGPMPMMRHIADIAEKQRIPLKVLMEKRMACGIGVCLSCVCRTRNGKSPYSRVCVDGPIFNANEIEWRITD